MLKIVIAVALLGGTCLCATKASAASTSVVSKRISGCDYFMVSTTGGYGVLEWYGEHDPDTGDTLIGKIEEYGLHEIVDDTANERSRP